MTAQEHSACSKRRVLTMTYDGVIGLLWAPFLGTSDRGLSDMEAPTEMLENRVDVNDLRGRG